MPLTENTIYQATVTHVETQSNNHVNYTDTRNIMKATYAGLTSTTFKIRYANHTMSFRDEKYRSKTTLSQYIWNLKDQGITYDITWKILSIAKPYSPSTKTCNLCAKENFYIIAKPSTATMNKRNELTSLCRHRRSSLISNF